MKRMRKISALLLSFVMVFSMSAIAFAEDGGSVTDGDTVTLTITIDDGSQDTPASTSCNVDLESNDTVYDVVLRECEENNILNHWISTPPDAAYSPLRDQESPLYDLSANAMILDSLDKYGSEPYTPSPSVEEYEDYVVGSDDFLDDLHDKYLEDYGGIAMWIGDGMAIMGDWQHMIYVGYDWTYTVNGSAPGISITPDETHPYDFFQYYMNEALVSADDEIVLTYSAQEVVF